MREKEMGAKQDGRGEKGTDDAKAELGREERKNMKSSQSTVYLELQSTDWSVSQSKAKC